MTDQAASPAAGAIEPTRHRAVSALRRALDSADPGTLAALRRGSPESPPAAFYRITAIALEDLLPEGGPRRDELDAGWMVVVSAMATAQGLLARVALGEALAFANVAELRVLRLLEAHDAQLADLVRHVVHQLVQRAQPFDPNDLADLVLTDGTPSAKQSRRRIARAFYRHTSA